MPVTPLVLLSTPTHPPCRVGRLSSRSGLHPPSRPLGLPYPLTVSTHSLPPSGYHFLPPHLAALTPLSAQHPLSLPSSHLGSPSPLSLMPSITGISPSSRSRMGTGLYPLLKLATFVTPGWQCGTTQLTNSLAIIAPHVQTELVQIGLKFRVRFYTIHNGRRSRWVNNRP